MTLLNALQLFFIGFLTLAFGVPGTLLALLLPGKALKGKLFLWVSKNYSRIVLFALGVRIACRGFENIDVGKPYVFMSNHVSHADSPALASVIPHPLHWVFKKELSKIRELGYAIDRGEQLKDVRCIGVPIMDDRDLVMASIWITGPADRLDEYDIDSIGRRLVELASSLSAAEYKA